MAEDLNNAPAPKAKMKEDSLFMTVVSSLWTNQIKPRFQDMGYTLGNELVRMTCYGINGKPRNASQTPIKAIGANGYVNYTGYSNKATVAPNMGPVAPNNTPVAINISKYAICHLEVPCYGDVEDIKYIFAEALEADGATLSAAAFYSAIRDQIPSCSNLPVLGSSYYGYGWRHDSAGEISSKGSETQPGWWTITLPRLERI